MLRRIRNWLLQPVTERLEKLMTDTTKLDASITKLEAQGATNKQLIIDLMAAVVAGQNGGITQDVIDGFQARVDAVATGEAADDAAGQGSLTPAPVDPAV